MNKKGIASFFLGLLFPPLFAVLGWYILSSLSTIIGYKSCRAVFFGMYAEDICPWWHPQSLVYPVLVLFISIGLFVSYKLSRGSNLGRIIAILLGMATSFILVALCYVLILGPRLENLSNTV